MKIVHEKPGSDLDWKVKAPLTVETPTGQAVVIHQWSLAGLEWPGEAPECPATGTLSVPFQGIDVRFPVRLAQDAEQGMVRFQGLSGRQRETLALFYRSLLSGRMVSSGEVITSLDTPVDLVPMEETEAEAQSRPSRFLPRAVRVALHVLTYLALAAAVVGVIGQNIFTNLDRIDIQYGRVLAPMAPAFPAASGYVTGVEVAPGQPVRQGDILLRLHDPDLAAALDQAETELALARADHARVVQALDRIDALAAGGDLSARMTAALRYQAEFIGQGDFADLRRQWLNLRDRDPALAETVDPLRIVRALLQVEAQTRAAAVTALTAAARAAAQQIDANHVRAPGDGTVQALTVTPGQRFSGAGEALLFETADPRMTVGWVSERFAETIYIGMPATIGFNENGTRITLPGAVWDVRAGDNPERPNEFGIIVTVRATGLTPDQTRARLRLAAPVNLEAKRQLGQRLRAWVRGWLRDIDPRRGPAQ